MVHHRRAGRRAGRALPPAGTGGTTESPSRTAPVAACSTVGTRPPAPPPAAEALSNRVNVQNGAMTCALIIVSKPLGGLEGKTPPCERPRNGFYCIDNFQPSDLAQRACCRSHCSHGWRCRSRRTMPSQLHHCGEGAGQPHQLRSCLSRRQATRRCSSDYEPRQRRQSYRHTRSAGRSGKSCSDVAG